ncbi:hypothetical protein [Mesorhizobium onobrychidis]|uniref:Uncharacterized protein n=1 Tax=Mesorhizobium onobrychidis TaxID=2775404 RepID=A0ABY5QWD1_9HYPH|nr:hypothetical protein [Mesorhizobium onobrychidis]UVC15229.1 hypothetical protein IHQ72_32530 [Mesorhizobium onobrychidis]
MPSSVRAKIPVVIVGAVHPDDPVLGLETEGQFLDERFAVAEVPGDTFDGVERDAPYCAA